MPSDASNEVEKNQSNAQKLRVRVQFIVKFIPNFIQYKFYYFYFIRAGTGWLCYNGKVAQSLT